MAFAPAMFRFRMMLRVGELMCLAGNRPQEPRGMVVRKAKDKQRKACEADSLALHEEFAALLVGHTPRLQRRKGVPATQGAKTR